MSGGETNDESTGKRTTVMSLNGKMPKPVPERITKSDESMFVINSPNSTRQVRDSMFVEYDNGV